MSFKFDLQSLRTQLDKVLQNDKVILPLAALGLFAVFSKFVSSACGFYQNVLQQPLNFREIYQDKSSWVVITGGSDGIGFGYAEYFADLKFNIVMIARSKEKLEKQQRILEQKYGIQVKIISADFNNTDIQFYKYLAFLLKDLDIAILINNVGGYLRHYLFSESSKEEINFILNANVYSTTFMTALLLPQLLKRQKRSAIINVGSGSAVVPIIGRAVYGGSKAFSSQFTNILQNDLKNQSNKVDVLCFAPNFIRTNLVQMDTFVQVPQAIRGSLKALGRRTYTKGHWAHAFQEMFMTGCPLKCIVSRQLNLKSKASMTQQK